MWAGRRRVNKRFTRDAIENRTNSIYWWSHTKKGMKWIKIRIPRFVNKFMKFPIMPKHSVNTWRMKKVEMPRFLTNAPVD